MNSGSSNRMPSSWGGEESYRPCLFSDLNFESMVLNIFSVFYQVKKKYFINGLPRLSRKYWLGYPGFSIVACNPQSAKPLPPLLSSCFIMTGNSIKLRALTPGTRHIESVEGKREGRNRNFKRLASGEARLDTNALFSWRHETGGKRTPPTF